MRKRVFFLRAKAAFNESFTEKYEMPFCVCDEGWTEGVRGGKMSERERKREREKREDTFQLVFSIQRHFDRAEPTLWWGVKPC